MAFRLSHRHRSGLSAWFEVDGLDPEMVWALCRLSTAQAVIEMIAISAVRLVPAREDLSDAGSDDTAMVWPEFAS